MKPEEAKKLGVLTCTLTSSTDTLFGLSFKDNFVTYQLYYTNYQNDIADSAIFYGTNYRNDIADSK